MATKTGAAGHAPRAPSKPGPKPVKLSLLDEAEGAIVEAIRNDNGYRAIANEYGVSKGTLIAWIQTNPDRSQACARARREAASACDEKAETVILEAGDPFELAKARELATHYRWRAKTRDPRSYGDKTTTTIEGNPDRPLEIGVAVRFVSADTTGSVGVPENGG